MGAKLLALQEQAEALGYSTIQEAIDAGYEMEYHTSGDHKLVKVDEQELAHRAWLREKSGVLADLRILLGEAIPMGDDDTVRALERAIDFVEGVRHE